MPALPPRDHGRAPRPADGAADDMVPTAVAKRLLAADGPGEQPIDIEPSPLFGPASGTQRVRKGLREGPDPNIANGPAPCARKAPGLPPGIRAAGMGIVEDVGQAHVPQTPPTTNAGHVPGRELNPPATPASSTGTLSVGTPASLGDFGAPLDHSVSPFSAPKFGDFAHATEEGGAEQLEASALAGSGEAQDEGCGGELLHHLRLFRIYGSSDPWCPCLKTSPLLAAVAHTLVFAVLFLTWGVGSLLCPGLTLGAVPVEGAAYPMLFSGADLVDMLPLWAWANPQMAGVSLALMCTISFCYLSFSVLHPKLATPLVCLFVSALLAQQLALFYDLASSNSVHPVITFAIFVREPRQQQRHHHQQEQSPARSLLMIDKPRLTDDHAHRRSRSPWAAVAPAASFRPRGSCARFTRGSGRRSAIPDSKTTTHSLGHSVSHSLEDRQGAFCRGRGADAA
eukprot:COSAG05_NODE_1308_length_5225_cov_3.554233_6_plen_454_part_00